MKRHAYIFIFGLTLGQFACNSSADRPKNNVEKSVSDDSVKQTGTTEISNVKDIRDKCVRGQAEPIIKKSVFPKTKFILQSDSLTAIEIVDFDNGDKLIIKNWGCEYYTLTFRFETSRFYRDTTDIEFWFNNAVVLLTEIKKGIDSPIDIQKGIYALSGRCESSFHMNYESFKLGDEVDFGGKEIRSFVSVDRIEKITDKKYAIEISFTTGPL